MKLILATASLVLVSCTINLDATNAVTGQTYRANINLAPITSSSYEIKNADGSTRKGRDISYYTVPTVKISPCKK